jgi:ornithine--oxo-acid transaminase
MALGGSAAAHPEDRMAFDIQAELRRHAGENYELHGRHLNRQMVRVLRTIGYDRFYEKGEGCYLIDRGGQRYLDFLSGFGVFALGRGHPVVKQALADALAADLPGLVQMDCALLPGLVARALLDRAPASLTRVFFANSGTEATEAALKFARCATGRPRILYCHNGYHGLTYGALSVNGETEFRQGFGPFLPGCDAIPFGDLEALERELARQDVAAFVTEPIQGHGVFLPPEGYLEGAQALCRQHGSLFVVDEVQTGLGRTGRFLACEHWGLEPDMITLAKALSGGYVPVGAVLCREEIFDRTFHHIDRAVVHGSTFGKNPLAMTAALATLHVIERENLVERAALMGERLMKRLDPLVQKYELLTDVRGKGLMMAFEFGAPRSLKLKLGWKMIEMARKGLFSQLVTVPLFQRHRILTQVAGYNVNMVKILPPLIITDTELDLFTEAFEDVVADCHRYPGTLWDFGRTLALQAIRGSSS